MYHMPMKSLKKLITRNDGDGRPPFDKRFASKIIDKHVIVGYTYNKSDGTVDYYEQRHGVVVKANEDEGVGIRLNNSDEVLWLPPDLRSWKPAQPGSYELISTGEVVIDPDYITTWIVDRPN